MSILAFLLTVVLVPMLVNEFTDWLPWFAANLIRLAARALPSAIRPRYVEEWLAELDAVPGKWSKLAFAFHIVIRAPATANAVISISSGSSDSIPAIYLGTALTAMVEDSSYLGLRVHTWFKEVPANLPPHITEALTGAAREALSNVGKHADVNDVWLDVLGNGHGGVTVRVTDHGVGMDFDAPTLRAGFGLTRCVRDRIIEAGGHSMIKSSPEHGTVVELSWNPDRIKRSRRGHRSASHSRLTD